MENLVEELTRGNVTEVKVVLASVVLALAGYQLVLIAVGYGRLRPSFLQAGPASKEQEAREDRLRERQELQEERLEQREQLREERAE